MTRCRTAILVGLGLLVVTVGPARAQGDTNPSRATLRGLPGVAVVVSNVQKDAQQDGLRRADLYTDVELTLRLAGIKVLTEVETTGTAAMPLLSVDLRTLKEDDRSSWGLQVSLLQYVTLASAGKAMAATWLVLDGGMVGAAELGDVRGVLKDTVNMFVNAWLAVNPKSR